MKPTQLRDLTAEDDVARVASALPADWKAALAAYLDDRRVNLKRGWAQLATFDAQTRRYEIASLKVIESKLCADVKKKPKLKLVERDRDVRPHHAIRLAALLTPDGWQEQYLPALQALTAELEASWLEGKAVEEAQATQREIDALVRFLYGVEDAARKAKKQQEQPAKAVPPRVALSRDPRSFQGATRSAM